MFALFLFADKTAQSYEVSSIMGAALLASWKAVQINAALPVPQTFLTLDGGEVPLRWADVSALSVTDKPPASQP